MTIFTTNCDETFTITDRIGTYYGESEDMQIIEATDENGEIASELYLNLTTGQIMQVETREENRGEGIATALAQYAVDNGMPIFHSPEEHRTEEGQRFAERTDFIDTIDPQLAYEAA